MNVTNRHEAKARDIWRKQQSPPSTHMFTVSAVSSWCHVMNWRCRILCRLRRTRSWGLIFIYFCSDFDEPHTKTKRTDPKAASSRYLLSVLSASSFLAVYQNKMSGFPHSFIMRVFTHHNLAKLAMWTGSKIILWIELITWLVNRLSNQIWSSF